MTVLKTEIGQMSLPLVWTSLNRFNRCSLLGYVTQVLNPLGLLHTVLIRHHNRRYFNRSSAA